jgi:hypothetical protein
MSFTYPCPRKLREVMKISMIEREPPAKIADIWNEYHSARINNTCAILSKEHYQHFVQRYVTSHTEQAVLRSSSCPSSARAGISSSSRSGKKTAS